MVQNLVCETDTHAVIDVGTGFQIVPLEAQGERPSPRADKKATFQNFRELVELAVALARSEVFDATRLGLLPENLGSRAYQYLPLVGKIPDARYDEAWEERCKECFPDFITSEDPVRVRHAEIEIDDVKLVFATDGRISLQYPGDALNPTWSAKALALLWIFILSDQRTEVATYTEMPNGQVYSPQYCPFLIRPIQQWGVSVQFQHFPEPEVAITASVAPSVPSQAVPSQVKLQAPSKAPQPQPRVEPVQPAANPVTPQAPQVVTASQPSQPDQPWDVKVRLRCEALILEL